MIASLLDGGIKLIPMEYQRGPLDPKLSPGNGLSIHILELPY